MPKLKKWPIRIHLRSRQELDDLLTALSQWTSDNRWNDPKDEDDVPDADGISPREDRMSTMYQRIGQRWL